MSMHKIELTEIEREGLEKHGLSTDGPSQLSDAFRQGVAWALEQTKPDPNVIDLDELSWESIKKAASESKWMPPEYMMNDWCADVRAFLRNGLEVVPQGGPAMYAVATNSHVEYLQPDNDWLYKYRDAGFEAKPLYTVEQMRPAVKFD